MDQSVLVSPEPAVRLRFNQNKDTPLPPEEPTGENPPAGAILDYVLPPGFEGPVQLEILAADGSIVRSFASDAQPTPVNARVYFAETWLGKPPELLAEPGHHRFTWNLRYAPPPTLESFYSIAATPGKPTPILPEGAFVLPGSYSVRLSAGGQTITKPFEVRLDPRVNLSQQDMASLLEFQQQVAQVLGQAVSLHDEIAASNEEAKTATMAQTPKKVAEALTQLAIDLEHSDAPPTSSQLGLFENYRSQLNQAGNEWVGLLHEND